MIKSKKLPLIIGMLIGMTSLTSCGSSSEETAQTAETVSQTAETTVPMTETEHETAEETLATPAATFKVESLENLHLGEDFLLENYYITNRTMAGNRFYIDENGALWGYGSNYYGQLGNGMADSLDANYSEPVKIAENVLSVDMSKNGYFCIYLTETGELYGMGSNMLGLLGQEFDTATHYTVDEYEKVLTPVLLMEDVSYARAGRESIVALKNDGSVWWWGEYKSTYSTYINDMNLYWKSTADETNPAKMLYNEPTQILTDCVYATTGDWTGAAITKNGELYTWGFNLYGECGVSITNDDYVRTPKKVLDNVKMVWPETLQFGDVGTEIPDFMRYDSSYNFNTFVELQDGTVMACGANLGDQTKTIAVSGDLIAEETRKYSTAFVPVELVEYSSDEYNREVLDKCKTGMSSDDVEKILTDGNFSYEWGSMIAEDNDLKYITAENNRYILYFDAELKLEQIIFQDDLAFTEEN